LHYNLVYSQIPDYSQIHTNYLYTNPAFAGINNCPHAYTSYRSKFSSIDGGYSTNYLSFDTYSSILKSDLGFEVLHDIQSSTFFTTSILGIYTKEFQLKKKLFLKTGIGAGILSYGIRSNNLIFSDMINPFDNEISETNEEISSINHQILDIEPGFLLYNDFFFSGITIKHFQEGITKKSRESNRLNRTISIHGGSEFSTTKAFTKKYLITFYPHINVTLSPTSSYTQIGLIAQKGKVQLGGAYRENLPFEAESFIVFVGFFEKKFKFAYNCDISINSHLTNNLNSHEISFSYNFDCLAKRKKYEAVKAPIF